VVAGNERLGTPIVSNAFDGTGTATMVVPLTAPPVWPEGRCFRVKALFLTE
jgi:hypothetical protein